ncbi:chaperone NapD [Pseudomonas mangrovi]|uniref:Chaperone NapD n=1 Tax=Pseudomonas mangrovi TaxID=2161748 RepID=A0A2T5PD55_9PSED|nr:chaperone NapD [Pseudomonas mangrovi]PTU75665.1 glutamate synthase [Pseudomonas mangrovi]
MEEILHIASLLVHCRPESMPAVSANLRLLPHLELHQESPLGKLVVVLETEHESQILDTIDQIQNLPGVLNAVLIYHELLNLEGENR